MTEENEYLTPTKLSKGHREALIQLLIQMQQDEASHVPDNETEYARELSEYSDGDLVDEIINTFLTQ